MNIKFHTLKVIVKCMFITAVSLPAEAQSPEDILIVANKGVSVNSISTNELMTIFLKQRTTWNNGSKAVPVHSDNTKLKAKFLQKILGFTIAEEETYWQNQKIKHGMSPPPEFSNNLKAVFKLKGSVSYIFRYQLKENIVKVLLELPQ